MFPKFFRFFHLTVEGSKRFLIIAAIALLARDVDAHAMNRDVCASCTYTTINAAVTAAQNNDVIRVATGTYSEDVSIQGTRNLTFEGGYNISFSARDPENTASVVRSFTASFHTGEITIDGFTVTDSNGAGIYIVSQNTDITVNDCTVTDHGTTGIMLYAFGTGTITNNYIAPTGTGYGALSVNGGFYSHTQVTISGNTITGQTCMYCYGLDMHATNSSDVIDNNLITGNKNGIALQFGTTDETPLISNNIIADNIDVGLYILGKSPIVEHNIFRDNGGAGIYALQGIAAKYNHNVFARNYKGLSLQGNNNTPEIRNNIFYQTTWTAVEIAGTGGWGGTNTIPSAFNYNNFYDGHGPLLVYSNLPAGSFSSEDPGSYGDFNGETWAEGNFKENPRFVDPANNDFHLATNSFLVDEGDPSSPYANEPATNGNRVNVGRYGNTADATASQATPTISNVSAAKNGSDILVTYDTNTATAALWTKLEYWDGSSYVLVNPRYVSGTGYTAGYKGGRAPSGAGRALRIVSVHDNLGLTSVNSSKVRVTVQHAADTAQAESGTFSGIFTPPTVALTAPAVGSTLTTTQPTFSATASDSDGIASVAFYYKLNSDDSWILLSSDTISPYVATWGSAALVPGNVYDFQVLATDILDNTASDFNYGVNYCAYSLTPDTVNTSSSASHQFASVTASQSNCAWSSSSNASWISISDSGSGSNPFSFNIAANTSSQSRSGTATIGGKTLTVNQQGRSCEYQLSKTTGSGTAQTGSDHFTLTASPSDCSWNALADSSWLDLSISSGTGSSEISFSYEQNSSTEARGAIVTIGDQQFSFTQSGTNVDLVTLRLKKSGTGSGMLVTGDQLCDSDCQETTDTYPRGTTVTLLAEPDENMDFVRWTGAGCGTSPSCVVTLNNDLTEVRGAFSQEAEVALIITRQGEGSITISPKGKSCGEGCYIYRASPTKPKQITLKAHSKKNTSFNRWTGDCRGKESSCTLMLKGADKNVSAIFRQAHTKR